MGGLMGAICKKCKNEFSFASGGGFNFTRLGCDRCDATKTLLYSDLEKHKVDFDDDKALEAFAGKCLCGGSFRVDAPPRCPKCKSTELEIERIGFFD
jgi:predicted Zn-ribbon and HTH transcriptional regulator